ncbi:uncharacterized protein LOC111268735 [Varroa jacobsoni]|uniref:Uncharacterized protein n=1 Tax=Varroa destructor TaxID=109461 RepID=A0A7M7KLM4_VARDE|nr:uncharacterized protein LOC111253515 [Varroa destructor]XP_022703623.1 uncharacterized protein LOC111268735 [Varroa jacobsoni]
MKTELIIAIGCTSFFHLSKAQGLLGGLGCSSNAFILQQTCPLHCDLARDTNACPICVCPPCIICPEPCYVPSFLGGLAGECPGCAPGFDCHLGFFRSGIRRLPRARPVSPMQLSRSETPQQQHDQQSKL